MCKKYWKHLGNVHSRETSQWKTKQFSEDEMLEFYRRLGKIFIIRIEVDDMAFVSTDPQMIEDWKACLIFHL